MLYDLISCDFKTSWWLNQPIWKMFVKMGENLSQCSGWKLTKNIWVATTYKNDPLKRLLLLFLPFSVVFMKNKTAKLSVFPPKNLKGHFPPKTPPKTWHLWHHRRQPEGLDRGSELYPPGGKTMRLHKIFRSSKKDHENSSGCSKKGSLYYWFIIPIPK